MAHELILDDVTLGFERGQHIGLIGANGAGKSTLMKMIAAMESFKQLFGGSHPLKKLIRGVGMCTADAIPVIKQRFITQAMGW